MDDTKSVVDEREAPSPEVLEKPVRRWFTVEYKAKIVAEADACTEPGALGVTKSHGRPHVSNDNPFSESQFKTLMAPFWLTLQ